MSDGFSQTHNAATRPTKGTPRQPPLAPPPPMPQPPPRVPASLATAHTAFSDEGVYEFFPFCR